MISSLKFSELAKGLELRVAEETSRFEPTDKSWGGATPGEVEGMSEKGLGSSGLWEGIDEYFRKTPKESGLVVTCDPPCSV